MDFSGWDLGFLPFSHSGLPEISLLLVWSNRLSKGSWLLASSSFLSSSQRHNKQVTEAPADSPICQGPYWLFRDTWSIQLGENGRLSDFSGGLDSSTILGKFSRYMKTTESWPFNPLLSPRKGRTHLKMICSAFRTAHNGYHHIMHFLPYAHGSWAVGSRHGVTPSPAWDLAHHRLPGQAASSTPPHKRHCL